MDRLLIFYYNPSELRKDVDLLFTFQPPTEETMTHEQSRVAWKVAHLSKGHNTTGTFEIRYSARLGFSVAQHPGEITILTDDPSYGWSEPSENGGNLLQAVNQTHSVQDIAFGTVTNERHGFIHLKPTFLFKVHAGNTVKANFHPKLIMYANTGYQGELQSFHRMPGKIQILEIENALISADRKFPTIWEANLSELPKTSMWIFAEKSKGHYTVTRDE
ncbi:hypothetical protein L218DRAFT_1006667 [Marasmius fiardii PR-910]|nr:hypothetical protein L218DRAFT_1006667 [Marasmius fiardii PR-910]